MRVPSIDSPTVSQSSAPEYNPRLRNADTSVQEGLQSIGKGLESVLEGAQEYVKKADALRETEALTRYRHEVNSDLMGDRTSQGVTDAAFEGKKAPTGFLNTRGTDASAQSAEVLERMEKRRQEIAGELNERQRARFLERSASVYEDARGKVEGHTSQQFRAAQVAASQAAQQAALDFAASSGGRGIAPSQMADVERSIRDLAVSPAAAEAELAKFKKEIAVATITAQLAAGDVETAEKQLELDRAVIGTQFAAVKHQVDLAKKSAAKVDLQAEASAKVMALAEELRNKGDGYVTERALRDAVKRPPPGPAQEAFDKAFEQQAKLEHEKLQAAIAEERANADRADFENVPIPEGTEQFLLKYDPKYLKGIERDQRAEARAWRVARDGSAREKREAAAAQAAFDKEVEQLYLAELVDKPDTNHEEFIRNLLAERDGDLSVSSLARARMKREGAEAVKGAGTKLSAAEKDFADDFGAELKAKIKPSGRGAKVDDELLQRGKGNAVVKYREWVAANGGKPLDSKAIAELKARLVKEAQLKPQKSFLGFKYGGERGPAVFQEGQTTEAPAAPRGPVQMRFPNGKTYPVEPDKVEQAKKKGGVIVDG